MRDHLEQAAPRMVVLLMYFEMLGEFVNTLTQERDLYLGRPRVAFVRPKIREDFLLRFFC